MHTKDIRVHGAPYHSNCSDLPEHNPQTRLALQFACLDKFGELSSPDCADTMGFLFLSKNLGEKMSALSCSWVFLIFFVTAVIGLKLM